VYSGCILFYYFNFNLFIQLLGPFLRTGCEDREYSFAEVLFVLFVFFAEKVCYLGSKYFFPDSSQKTNGTPWSFFFDILASFGVKNVCALFREIE